MSSVRKSRIGDNCADILHLRDRARPADAETLRVVDPGLAQFRERVVALHEFNDGVHTHLVSRTCNRPDFAEVGRVGEDVLDDDAVDLDEIKRQAFERCERHLGAAEGIEREAATDCRRSVDLGAVCDMLNPSGS